MKWTGTLMYADLGPGSFVLRTADGREWPLLGEVPKRLSGRQVVVTGRKVSGMGIAMTGAPGAIEVAQVSAAASTL